MNKFWEQLMNTPLISKEELLKNLGMPVEEETYDAAYFVRMLKEKGKSLIEIYERLCEYEKQIKKTTYPVQYPVSKPISYNITKPPDPLEQTYSIGVLELGPLLEEKHKLKSEMFSTLYSFGADLNKSTVVSAKGGSGGGSGFPVHYGQEKDGTKYASIGGGGGGGGAYPEGFKSAFEASGGVGMPGGKLSEPKRFKLDPQTRSILIQKLSSFLYQVLKIDLHYANDQMAYVLVQRLNLECPLCEGEGVTLTQHVNQYGEELKKEETACIVCQGTKNINGYQEIKIADQEIDRILGMIYG